MSTVSSSPLAPAAVRALLASDGLPALFTAAGVDIQARADVADRFALRNWVENWASPSAVRFFADDPTPSRVLVNNEAAALLSMYVGIKWSALARAGFRRVNASGPAALFVVRPDGSDGDGVRVPVGASSVVVRPSDYVRIHALTF